MSSVKRIVFCSFFSLWFYFDRAVTFIESRLFLEDCSEEGTAHIYIPISGCLQTLCCCLTDLHLICRVKGVWRHLNFVNYCICGFYLWCNVNEYMFILYCFLFLNNYLTELPNEPLPSAIRGLISTKKMASTQKASIHFSQLQKMSRWVFLLTWTHNSVCVRHQRLEIASNAKTVWQTLKQIWTQVP